MNFCMTNPHYSVVDSVHPTPEQVRVIPLFADLDELGLAQISRGLVYKHVPQNAYLFRQGSDADTAFFVQSGALSVDSALPGGGEVHLANIGPGNMLGEMSLVATGVRTASVRADTDVVGFSMERWFFQSSLAHASPATARILRQLIQIVGERLRSQYAQIIPMEAGGNTSVPGRNDSDFRSGFDDATKTRSFSYPEFLPRLGFFSKFQPEEILMFSSKVRSLELPRDVILFEKDERPASCFFIVRGALELCAAQDDGRVPIAVLGPGTFLGTTEIISGGVRVACGRVREEATIFEISADTLLELLSDHSCFALKFQLAFCESLIVDLGTINKRMARVTSQESASTRATHASM
ncbi:cyclic nucleotide-binding domain-containing protein [Gammaproteobacteria bacterium]|nr:cyclic nucleotide-binding domain-containing protein [Gammaproteobacteria bacterium]